MNIMSEEQFQVLEHIRSGKNVIVDAIAGSGKSTTILSVAEKLPDKQILQITYNSMLRHEIKDKVKTLKIENLNVHTFHSLAVRYYMPSAHTDNSLRYILYNKLPPLTKIPHYQLLVLDEAQDMSLLYYQFVVKFSKDMGSRFQLLVLGDYKQGLYEFKGADTRFLTMADELWKLHPQLNCPEFVRTTLKMSYRITHPMASFVNHAMLGETRMFACKDGEQVHYLRHTRSNTERFVVAEIQRLLDRGAKPSDFFILGASTRGFNIRKMENVLVENNIPCHVPMLEGESIDERVIDGKVVFSTFHSVKGRQRKYVFVIGFDNSYYYSAKYASREICPNTLYVAATRATGALYLLEKNDFGTDRPLSFLKMNHHLMRDASYIDFKGMPQTIFYEKIGEPGGESSQLVPRYNITPSDLIKFISETVIEEISPILDKIFVKVSVDHQEIDLPTLAKTRRGFFEDVSDLNGIAIPCIYYHHIQRRWKADGACPNILKRMIQNNMEGTKETEHRFLKNIIGNMPDVCTKIMHYLYAANVYSASQEKLYFKLNQIEADEYNWLEKENVNKCLKRMDATIMPECVKKIPVFEKVLIDYSMETEHEEIDAMLRTHFDDGSIFRFSGRLDLVTEHCVWELKCTSRITIDHMLQVVIYAWLWQICVGDGRKVKIFNIKSGEILELKATMEELTHIVVALLKGKYSRHVVKSDEEFIAECCRVFD